MRKFFLLYCLAFLAVGCLLGGIAYLDDLSKGSLKTGSEYLVIILLFPAFGIPVLISWSIWERGSQNTHGDQLPNQGDPLFFQIWKAGFQKGDAVKVRPGTSLPGRIQLFIDGWQGLVKSVDGDQVTFELDSQTLQEIPQSTLEIVMEKGVDFERLTLSMESLEKVSPRESEDTTQLAPLIAWERLLVENIRVPFSAAVRESTIPRIQAGERVLVKNFGGVSGTQGILVQVEKKSETLVFPLAGLENFDLPSAWEKRLRGYLDWSAKRRLADKQKA